MPAVQMGPGGGVEGRDGMWLWRCRVARRVGVMWQGNRCVGMGLRWVTAGLLMLCLLQRMLACPDAD